MITEGRTEAFPLTDVAHVRQALVMLPRFRFHDVLEQFLVYWRVRKACEWFGISLPAYLMELTARMTDEELLDLWQRATAAWDISHEHVNDSHILYIQSFVQARSRDLENHPKLLALADVAAGAR